MEIITSVVEKKNMIPKTKTQAQITQTHTTTPTLTKSRKMYKSQDSCANGGNDGTTTVYAAAPVTFDLDNAWLSFMAKNDDEEPDDIFGCEQQDQDEYNKYNEDAVNPNTQKLLQLPQIQGPIKKTCISKKQHRKTYTFLDEEPRAFTLTDHDIGQMDKLNLTDKLNHTDKLNQNQAQDKANNLGQTDKLNQTDNLNHTDKLNHDQPTLVPKCGPIYISTKTKISYLNKAIDIKNVFWSIPIMPYSTRKEGIIKKQIKFHTTDINELRSIQERLKSEPYYEDQVIEHIDNPEKQKYQHKITVGLCKKDIMSHHCKKKRAFFNCFVLIMRIKDITAENAYKEMHIKVFNTGKLEIPGIQDDAVLTTVLNHLVSIMRPYLGDDLDYVKNKCETVLINSNFNCGFYINRDKLFDILKYEYRINSNYDACSYPGIQCKFYYVPDLEGTPAQNGQQPVDPRTKYYEISFMVFRTGSILIVGKCNEKILNEIYGFIRLVLENEYSRIGILPTANDLLMAKKKNPKLRTRYITIQGTGDDYGDQDDGGYSEAI
jgi:hypothetical protein